MKRLAYVFVVLALLSLALVAFAGPQAIEEPVEEETKEPVTITYIDWEAYEVEVLDEIFAAYSEENPHVSFEVMHQANEYTSVLQTRVASGQIPDIFIASAGSMLDEYAEYAYDWAGDPILDIFLPDAVATSTYPDGRVLSLPYQMNNIAIVYNKQVFADNGITELPKTINELEEVCKTLAANDQTCFGIGYNMWWILAQLYQMWFSQIDANPVVASQMISDGEVKLADMEWMDDMFKFIDISIKYGYSKPFETGWEEAETMTANGETAMMTMGDWAEAYFLGVNPEVELGFLPVPLSIDEEKPVIAYGVGIQYILHKDSPNFDEAKKFLEYFFESDIIASYIVETRSIMHTVKNDKEMTGMLVNDGAMWIDEGLGVPWQFGYWPSGFAEKFHEIIQSYILGDITQAEAVEMMDASWQELK